MENERDKANVPESRDKWSVEKRQLEARWIRLS